MKLCLNGLNVVVAVDFSLISAPRSIFPITHPQTSPFRNHSLPGPSQGVTLPTEVSVETLKSL
jgi:hypothetical protein